MTPPAHTFGQALQAHRAGNFRQAERLYRQVLDIDPGHVEAWHSLGLLYRQMGRNDLAVDFMRQALRHRPDHVAAYNNLGNALKDLGRLDEAAANYRQALRLKPDLAEVYNNLANVLKEQGIFEEAAANYRQALRLKPDYAFAHSNLGNLLREQGQFAEAVASYREALRLEPDFAEAYNNLGNTLLDLQKFDEAQSCYREALRIKPDYAEAYNNLGTILKDQGDLDDAVQHFQHAIRLKPGYAEAHNNLGNVQRNRGQFDEALHSYRRALEWNPGYSAAHDNLVCLLHYHPDGDSRAILREAQEWNRRHAAAFANRMPPHQNAIDPERRLRIGYISPDFRDHAGAHFTIPLFSHHDRGEVEIFCYAEVACPDAFTQRLQSLADGWRSTTGLRHDQVAEMIRSDRVDILIDLALHTANNRLLVLARKPAPVQVTWLGYPGTTGLPAIDYRLSDPYLDPPGEDLSCYSEETIRLETFWCYDPLCEQPAVNALPALSSGVVTFGCLNNFCKVNSASLALWANVLHAVPNSRLLLLAPRGQARDHVLSIMHREGIAGSRVEFIDRQSRPNYLQSYQRIDMGLDPFPYNGHTTSLDAFWMGVPVITRIGQTVVGRAGWSQLQQLGLPELAARTPEEYVAIAARLAGELPSLQQLRSTLRQRMSSSPLMDGERFARGMERVYRAIWRTWCRSEPDRCLKRHD